MPIKKEAQRVDDALLDSHHAVDANAFLERLASRADQREGGHRRAEQGHQQQKGTNRVAGQQIVSGRAAKQPIGEQTQRQQHAQVDTG